MWTTRLGRPKPAIAQPDLMLRRSQSDPTFAASAKSSDARHHRNTKLKFALFLDEEGQIHAREITDMGMISIIKYNSSSQHFIRTLFLSDTTILIILAIIKMLHFKRSNLCYGSRDRPGYVLIFKTNLCSGKRDYRIQTSLISTIR